MRSALEYREGLAVDTAVPTPSGWTTIGELEVGTEVFDQTGRATRVEAISAISVAEECRAVRFSEHTVVVCSLQHPWFVRTKLDRSAHRAARVVSTAQIERTLRLSYAPREYNHHVAQALPVAHRSKQVPLDPYVLGAWLGDGTTTQAEITCADEAILAEIERAGISVRPASGPIRYRLGGEGGTRDPATGRYMGNGSLSTVLRELGLAGNKHIPDVYLHASIDQRRALLAGLMDTDGYVDRLGRCDLTTVRRDSPISVTSWWRVSDSSR